MHYYTFVEVLYIYKHACKPTTTLTINARTQLSGCVTHVMCSLARWKLNYTTYDNKPLEGTNTHTN